MIERLNNTIEKKESGMNIVEMVEELFRNVPYSAPAQEAKKRITSALTREYDMLI